MSTKHALQVDPILDRANHVVIHITRDIEFDIEKLTKITKEVLGKLGCDGCHSGRVLDFRVIEEFVVDRNTLDVREIVGVTRF